MGMEKVTNIKELKRVHSYAVSQGIDPSQLMKIVARSASSGNELLGVVDYYTLDVKFDAQIDSDLVLDVFVNREMYDELSVAMSKDVFYNNAYALTPLLINVPDLDSDDPDAIKQIKVRVYRFNSVDEMESDELEKMFRVQTLYGIGYVGLVPEGSNNASDIKICLGYNKYNNPIIRCLEKI